MSVINQVTMKVHWSRCLEEMRNASLVCHKSASDKGLVVLMCGRDEECFSLVCHNPASDKGGLAATCEKDEECFFHLS